MAPKIGSDWKLDVERGLNCLLVKIGKPLGNPSERSSLAEKVRPLVEEHFTYRLVLELDQINVLTSDLIGELLSLNKWIRTRHGAMRLCGLSHHNLEVLRRCRLDDLFVVYPDRSEALSSFR
jgi:anti-anti-sigma factor